MREDDILGSSTERHAAQFIQPPNRDLILSGIKILRGSELFMAAKMIALRSGPRQACSAVWRSWPRAVK